MGINITKQ